MTRIWCVENCVFALDPVFYIHTHHSRIVDANDDELTRVPPANVYDVAESGHSRSSFCDEPTYGGDGRSCEGDLAE